MPADRGDGDLRAVSLTQPFAHAVIHLKKGIENRKRCSSHRGLTLIHASAGMTVGDYEDAVRFIDSVRSRLGIGNRTPPRSALERGGIIGAVDFLDCVDRHDSPWFVGPFAYVIANPRPIPFIPCKGTIFPLFWVPPPEVLARAKAALGLPD
jgi:hypothetical protein